ncbi:POTRA domain-containing protein [Ramlibacter sp.]|nr:POTRA domain-containing protein [Ramlibacter sp.]
MSSVVTALRRRLPDREQPCFPLARIDWQFGDSALPSWQTWLEAALAGPDGDDAPLGRCIGVVGVALLQDRAQEAVVRRGYITTRVVAPEQNLQSGELRFVVIPGRIRSIRPVGGGGHPPFAGSGASAGEPQAGAHGRG